MENKNLILDIHSNSAEILGFWEERYKSELLKSLEIDYTTEIIKYWFIIDVVLNNDTFLIKWKKRFKPLNEEELKYKYGR